MKKGLNGNTNIDTIENIFQSKKAQLIKLANFVQIIMDVFANM